MGKYQLETWSKQYHQEADCCASEDGTLIVTQDDGGGGPFWTITTERWAFDDLSELIELLTKAGIPMHVPKEEEAA